MKSPSLPKLNFSFQKIKSPSLPKFDFKRFIDSFRNLNPNDPGAWPEAPRITLLIVLFIGILTAGWALDWRKGIEALDRSKEQEVNLKREFTEKKSRSINLDLYKQQLSEIDRAFGVLLKQLPSRSEVESLLIEINQSGMGRGLQFELFKPNPEIVRDFYAELPISIRLTGNYHDFGAFASDISKLSRIVTLANISIAAPAQARDGSLIMNATTRTFRYLDEEELAAQRRAQANQRGRR